MNDHVEVNVERGATMWDVSKMYFPAVLVVGMIISVAVGAYSIATKLSQYTETLTNISNTLSSIDRRVTDNELAIKHGTDKRYRVTDAKVNFENFCLRLIIENADKDISCPNIFAESPAVYKLKGLKRLSHLRTLND